MPKSIIDIEVKDAQFKAFTVAFGKYQDALKKMPEGWQKAGAATTQQGKNLKAATDELRKTKAVLTEIGAAQSVITARQREGAQAEKEAAKEAKERAKTYKAIAGYVKDTTFQLAKWAAFGFLGSATAGIFGSGLLGSSANGLRRTSQGLGVAPGDLRAAESTYGRYLDVQGTLGNITNAQTDLSKRWILAGLGVSDQDAKNKSSAELLPQLLPALVNRYKQLGSNAQGAQAAGLDQLVDTATLRRLASLSSGELNEAAQTYGTRRQQFAISDTTLKKWQDFDAQLDAAKFKIENSFLVNLDKLAPVLSRLSDTVAGAIDNFLKTKDIQKVVEEWSANVGKFANYVGSESFQTSVKQFASDVQTLAHGLSVIVGLIPSEMKLANFFERIFGVPYSGPSRDINAPVVPNTFGGRFGVHANPGNIRNGPHSFATFASNEDGVRAIAHQLQLYYSGKSKAAGYRHLDTVRDIISTYAPPSENDTAAYIKNVASALNVKSTDHINLNDADTLSKLVAAITRQEGSGYKATPAQVAVIIRNETGGNTIAVANQLAH